MDNSPDDRLANLTHIHQVIRLISGFLLLTTCGGGAARAQEIVQQVTSPTDSASILQQAETAFVANQFSIAFELASRIENDDPLGARARYLQGYALYKLDKLERAAVLLQEALALASSSEAEFLAGLVAFKLGQWQQALSYLKPLAAEQVEPWAGPAQELLDQLHLRSTEEEKAEAHTLHTRAIQQAKDHLRQGKYQEARLALERAEKAVPGHLLNYYYRGYLAFEEGDHPAARRYFQQALHVKPHDSWSSYMLALSLDDSPDRKRAMLENLATGSPDAAVREAATRAMARRTKPVKSSLSIQLELNAGLDSNPALATGENGGLSSLHPERASDRPLPPPPLQATSSQDDDVSSAMALGIVVDLAYLREIVPSHQGGIGFRFSELDYPVGGEDQEKTELAAWIHYAKTWRRIVLSARYYYTFFMLSHAPTFSLHELNLRLAVSLRPWLDLETSSGFFYRDVHDETFQHQEARELSGAVGLKGRFNPLTLRLRYHLLRSWSNRVDLTLIEDDWPEKPFKAIYRTDHTQLAHGPEMDLSLSLPWRCSLAATTWLLLGHYDQADQILEQPIDVIIWEHRRFDLLVLADGELRRPLFFGFEGAIHYSSVTNFSSLDSSTLVNKSYSRHMVIGAIRWHWPIR